MIIEGDLTIERITEKITLEVEGLLVGEDVSITLEVQFVKQR